MMVASPTFDGRARIWTGDPPQVAGAGVLVSSDIVVTCLHVVQRNDVLSTDISVDFPDDAGGGGASAVVHERGRHQRAILRGVGRVSEERSDDIVSLRLTRPAGVRPGRLMARAVDGQQVRVFGFPAGVPEGVWASATVTGEVHRRTSWHQLDRASGSVAIERGFSGGGVFGADGMIVGLVVARVVLSGQVVAWMIPVTRWAELLPATRFDLAPNDVGAAIPTLSFAHKYEIAKALGEISVIDDIESRRVVVRTLSFAGSVPHHATKDVNVFALVGTALEFPGGFAELYAVVATLAGPTALPVIRLRELAVAYGLLPEGDKQP